VEIHVRAARVRSLEEFIELVTSMRSAMGTGDLPDSVNVSLEGFLEAIEAWLSSWAAANRPMPPNFDWEFAAAILMAGWMYE
jgi:hypothetical protein